MIKFNKDIIDKIWIVPIVLYMLLVFGGMITHGLYMLFINPESSYPAIWGLGMQLWFWNLTIGLMFYNVIMYVLKSITKK